MIRMILIYTGLFAAAAVALWLRPASTDVAQAGESLNYVETASLVSSARPALRPSQDAGGVQTVSTDAMERFRSTSGLASLVVRELEQDSTAGSIATLSAQNDGAVDLAPLLEVPGSVRNADGTRVLASALLRAPSGDAPVISLDDEITNIATISVSPEPKAQTYIVQEGDSLASIARAHYGSTNAYREIFQANRDVLRSMDSIRVGQELRLP